MGGQRPVYRSPLGVFPFACSKNVLFLSAKPVRPCLLTPFSSPWLVTAACGSGSDVLGLSGFLVSPLASAVRCFSSCLLGSLAGKSAFTRVTTCIAQALPGLTHSCSPEQRGVVPNAARSADHSGRFASWQSFVVASFQKHFLASTYTPSIICNPSPTIRPSSNKFSVYSCSIQDELRVPKLLPSQLRAGDDWVKLAALCAFASFLASAPTRAFDDCNIELDLTAAI